MSKARRPPDHVEAATLAVAIIKREPVGSPERNLARCYLHAIKAVQDLDGALTHISDRANEIGGGVVSIADYLRTTK